MSLLFKKLLFLFLPLAAFTAATNYFVDPACLFRQATYEKGIAKHLLAGQNVSNIHNFDERLLQLFYTEGLKLPPGTLVLGSSRSMQIGVPVLQRSLFNSAVSGATLEDDVAIYQLYRRRGLIPRQVLIGLDPWLLDRSVSGELFLSLNQHYEELLRVLDVPPPRKLVIGKLNKWGQLLSPSYLQSSLKRLVHCLMTHAPVGGSNDFTPTTATEADGAIRLADGSLSYDRLTRERQPAEIESYIARFIAERKGYSLELQGRSSAYERLFREFVHLMKKDGVSVSFLLVPYHPLAFHHLGNTPDGERLREAEAYFRTVARNEGIPVFGSYNPSPFAIPSSDFFDLVHPKGDAISKVMRFGPLRSDGENHETSPPNPPPSGSSR